ncbi:MAG: sulfatase-like hydrolase/transferase [Candidatus Omnitrophota bacterium]
MKRLSFLGLILASMLIGCMFGIIPCVAGQQQNDALPNIIVVTLTGVRPSESIEDPVHQYLPFFWNTIRPGGTLYTQMLDKNFPFHMPSVGSINTGLWAKDVFADINRPSFFQYIARHYGLPPTKHWIIGEWSNQSCCETADYPRATCPSRLSTVGITASDQLLVLLNEDEKSFFRQYKNLEGSPFFTWPMWDSLNLVQHRFFRKIMADYKPALVHYVINATDSAHFHDYGSYVAAIKSADGMLRDLWEIITTDPAYKGNTYLIVTPDHGRNAYYLDHTENSPQLPSRVWMYIYGPAIRKGLTITREVSHVDVFSTIMAIACVHAEQGTGVVLEDCFDQNQRK